MTEIDVLYNRYGQPIFRVLENGRVVTFSGKSVGFVKNNSLYNYSGKHVGWYSNGLVRDHIGQVVAFGGYVTDIYKPFLTYKQYKPYAGFVEYEPFRPYTQFEPHRPYKSYGWSTQNLETLFN